MDSFSKLQRSCIGAGALVLSSMFPAAAWANADAMTVGKALFTTGAVPACKICHTLKDAGATGAVGPDLDELQPSVDQISKAVREGVGSMPSFKGKLSEAQIKALALYVAKASGGQ